MGDGRTLLVCCGAFRGKPDFENLTVKKIPQAVLSRCEWGLDDYSLNVANLPMAMPDPVEPAAATEASKKSKSKKVATGQGGLFGDNE